MMSRAGVVVLAAAASGRATGVGPPIVKLLPTGPSPASITIPAGGPIMFEKTAPEGDAHIVFDNTSCALVSPRASTAATTTFSVPVTLGSSYTEITPCELTVPSGGWIDGDGQIRPYFKVA